MSKYRRAESTDNNQKDIVKELRKFATVELNHDDILVGYKGINYWYEIKNPNVANKSGEVYQSKKQDGQIKLEKEWKGHYKIVSSLDEILADINIIGRNNIALALAKEIIEG